MAITPTADLAAEVRALSGENTYLCYQCQKCSVGCPTAHAMTYRPAQIMRAVQFGLEELLLKDASIWRCLTCETCGTFCPNDLHPRDVIEVLRCMVMDDNPDLEHDHVLDRGVRALRMLAGRIDEAHNISGDANDNRLIWADNLPEKPPYLDRKEGAETAYFVGCVSSLYPMSYGVPQAFVTVLEKAGEDYTTLGGEEWCCGYPLLIGGQVKAAEEVIRHNTEVAKSLGIKRMVMTCPSCYHAWHHAYPEVVGDLGFEVVHATQMLAEMLDEGRLQLKEGRNMTVTYHDPCDLGRAERVFDAPRELIRSIPGVDLVELDQNRENCQCCGGGGNLEMIDADLSAEIARQKIEEVLSTGAQAVVTSCQQCVRTMMTYVRRNKVPLEVLDSTQLLHRALKKEG